MRAWIAATLLAALLLGTACANDADEATLSTQYKSPGRISSPVRKLLSGINWEPNGWALGCDFHERNMFSTRTPSDQCGPKCVATQGCTHFVWSRWEGGTCFLKHGAVSRSNAFPVADKSIVCGIVPNAPSPPAAAPAPLQAPPRGHNFCLYRCSIITTGIFTTGGGTVKTEQYHNTFFPYVESDNCAAAGNLKPNDREWIRSKVAHFAEGQSGNTEINSDKVYVRFTDDTQYGQAVLEREGEKDYNSAAPGEYFGWLTTGGRRSKCIKRDRTYTPQTGWIDTAFPVRWTISCWEIGDCQGKY